MKTNEQLNTYPVNGEGWKSEHLYRVLEYTVSGWEAICEKAFITGSDIELKPSRGRRRAEQRHTDQQIALLQKDERWIAWNAGDGEVYAGEKLMIDIKTSGEQDLDICLDSIFTGESMCWDADSAVIAYRLTTNADYFEGVERVTWQNGDYVEFYYTGRPAQDPLHEFIVNSGIETKYLYEGDKVIYNAALDGVVLRWLTLAQVLNAENAKSEPKEDAGIDPSYQFRMDVESMLNQTNSTPEPERNDVIDFATKVLHGNQAHKHWLLTAARCYVEGKELPEVNTAEPKTTVEPEYMPKVGEECELSNCGNPYENCTILFLGESIYVVNMRHGEQHYHKGSVVFRPIQTPKEQVIEKAMSNFCSSISSPSYPIEKQSVMLAYRFAYDAGMLIEGGE